MIIKKNINIIYGGRKRNAELHIKIIHGIEEM